MMGRPFLNILNKVEIVNHKGLTDYINKRPKGVPLITVSNHCSSLDEPLLFSALIPWPIKQWQLRYSLWYFPHFVSRNDSGVALMGFRRCFTSGASHPNFVSCPKQ
jgi:hypothetical protein